LSTKRQSIVKAPLRRVAARSLAHPIRDNLSVQVLRDLAARLDRGELKSGDRLPTERELMVRYGVSRTVVREAMSSLRASGRVATHQGRGGFVLESTRGFKMTREPAEVTTLQDVILVLDLRIGLESEAAALAAKHRTPAQLQDLQAAWKALQASVEAPDASTTYDIQFHMAIARATNNHYFVDLLGKLAPVMIPRARVDLFKSHRKSKTDYLQRIQLEHAQIHQAIARGDADAARAAMRLHLTNSRERLRLALEEQQRAR
jgi:GntR family transcriptional regulator, transcriptional repressor for pyruvate dehydrogenase complex